MSELIVGDCRDVMATFEAESIDAIVCDPPYGLEFMGRGWDHGVPGRPFWEEALRVAKPGAHLLAFGGTRTVHRLAVAIEDAGWDIRDGLVWAYAQGFPKSHNLSGEWSGWGTALKPAWEPIIARKPLRGTVAANVLAFGTGALNIAGTRIEGGGGDGHWSGEDGSDATSRPGFEGGFTKGGRADRHGGGAKGSSGFVDGEKGAGFVESSVGRWPANVILTDPIFDGGTKGVEGGGETSSGFMTAGKKPSFGANEVYGKGFGSNNTRDTFGDSGTYSRFFLIPKAGRTDREPSAASAERFGLTGDRVNDHPTVKPVELMRHLVRLVTPPGGLVLDPFMGSGTTGVAAAMEKMRFVGIDLDQHHVQIAKARVADVTEGVGGVVRAKPAAKAKPTPQPGLFDGDA